MLTLPTEVPVGLGAIATPSAPLQRTLRPSVVLLPRLPVNCCPRPMELSPLISPLTSRPFLMMLGFPVGLLKTPGVELLRRKEYSSPNLLCVTPIAPPYVPDKCL